MTDADVVGSILLDWLYERSRDRPEWRPRVNDFLAAHTDSGVHGLLEANVEDALAGLKVAGSVEISRGLGALREKSLALTDTGKIAAGQASDRRSDPSARFTASVDAVISWLNKQRLQGHASPSLSGIYRDPWVYFEGMPLTEDDLTAATRYLHEKGLIKGHGSWGAGIMRPALTSGGVDCAMSGRPVVDYLKREGNTGFKFTFHGPFSGNFAQGSNNTISQVASTSTGYTMASLTQYLEAMLLVRPLLACVPQTAPLSTLPPARLATRPSKPSQTTVASKKPWVAWADWSPRSATTPSSVACSLLAVSS